MPHHEPDLVILTGMSGAGRTEAMHALEDIGYYCIDNLPPRLFADLLDLEGMPGQTGAHRKIAVVCDTRTRDFFNELKDELLRLEESQVDYRLVFLDATDEKLIARYKSSRRRHPLCDDGASIGDGIQKERSLLYPFKELAHDIIDTSDMLPQELKKAIRELFDEGTEFDSLNVTVYSFGFKHGSALDADLVIDVRFLPNPYYDPIMRTMTGLDAIVRDFVMHAPQTEEFLKAWFALLDCVMPGYVKEGKQQLAIAVGCTGGQHRSVALAEATGTHLKAEGYRVSIAHRDIHFAQTKLEASASDFETDEERKLR
ncbi:MAG: RNase adapter RapZ [Raoultibacter sp.]|jgi:UPF0042 nucleotide-binding protein